MAHGDDPQRAVRAVADMHGAMARLSAEVGRKLEIHSGIANGEVVAALVGQHRIGCDMVQGPNPASKVRDNAV